jgi:hypothetical protein
MSPPYFGRAAGSPDVLAAVEALLAAYWDPNGEWQRAVLALAPLDGGRARTLSQHAAAICGLLGAGGSEAEVMGYLRREEEAVWPEARSAGGLRAAIAGAAWRIVRGVARPEDLVASRRG